MDKPSTSREKSVPKFSAVSNRINCYKTFQTKDNSNHFHQQQGLKRKNDSQITFGGKRAVHHTTEVENVDIDDSGERRKYSANARLMQYRKTLQSAKNQVIKVHTLERQNTCQSNAMLHRKDSVNVSLKDRSDWKSVNDRLKKHKQPNSRHCVAEINEINREIEMISHENETVVHNDTLKDQLQVCNQSACGVDQSNSNIESEDFDMDWSPISEEQLLTNINNIRTNFDEILNHKPSIQTSISCEIPRNNYIFKDTFIVVDTNIFLSHLRVVQYLLNVKLNGVYQPFLLIPWVVIQELDYMKDGKNRMDILQTKARKAVEFINKNLLVNGTTLKGQSVIDATQHNIQFKNFDDGILACCLQVFERGNRAILLSNDKNLRNKSLIHSVPAYSAEEIFKELEISPPSVKQTGENLNFSKFDVIKNHLTTLFNTVIHGEALGAYGEYYYKMGIFKGAPWNLEQCLMKFQKLWIAVFSVKLPKEFIQNVEEFRKLLQSFKSIKNEVDHEKFVQCGLNICLHLKNNLNDYFSITTECIEKILELK